MADERTTLVLEAGRSTLTGWMRRHHAELRAAISADGACWPDRVAAMNAAGVRNGRGKAVTVEAARKALARAEERARARAAKVMRTDERPVRPAAVTDLTGERPRPPAADALDGEGAPKDRVSESLNRHRPRAPKPLL